MSDLKLPIDVVDPRPGVRGKTFKWTYTTDGLAGRKVVPCEGSVSPSMEAAVTDLIALAKTLHARLCGKDGALEVLAKVSAERDELKAELARVRAGAENSAAVEPSSTMQDQPRRGRK